MKFWSTGLANSTGVPAPDLDPNPPTHAETLDEVTEPGVDREYGGRWNEWLVRTNIPWPFRADGVETRIPMRFVGFTSRPSEGQAMATRHPFTGAHAVIARNPTGFPVGAWAGNSQPNRLVFRRIPEAWDSGSEHG